MLDFAMRCQASGHDTKWHFKRTDRTKNFGNGLVTIVDDWREYARWADIIILADNTKYLREVDAWRKSRGCLVLGATVESAAWELDRTLGQSVFKKAGIPVLPYKEFSDYDTAISYVKRENRRFVSKPCGDEPDKSLSYVAKSPADLVYMLTRWKRMQKLKGRFILQEHASGTEMAVGAWFGPDGFMTGWCENFEEKSLFPGGLGPNCGETGTTLWYTSASKLARKVLAPLEDALAATGHTGYVDINCIIDENGDPWPLEATMRPGWPTFNIQQALHEGDPVEWLADLSAGRGSQPKQQPVLRLSTPCVGVVIALPDFPYSHVTRKEVTGVPVYLPQRDSFMDRIHPCEIMAGEAPTDINGKVVTAPCWLTSGDYVLVVTGTGDSIRQARESTYRAVDQIKIPASPFWRKDIGQRLAKCLPEIQRHGYATGLQY
jgi:phosphoribosylamine--glycine ligase